MADVHDKKTRSYNMSRVKGKDTKPEMVVRRFLHAEGFRYRLHVKDLPGKPDLVFPKYKTVVFIHGCFWHGHEGCKYFVIPKTNTQWWQDKIEGNKQRDYKSYRKLRESGWKVIVLFECELKKEQIDQRLSSLVDELKDSDYEQRDQ